MLRKNQSGRRQFLMGGAGLIGAAALYQGLGGMPGWIDSAKAGALDIDQFWMPEESDPHLRTFMQWPVNRVVHTELAFLEWLQETVAGVANAVVDFEPVVMLMAKDHIPNARRYVSERVEIWDIPTDDLWCRDSGPVFVRDDAGQLAVSLLNFNGWGGKQVHDNDGSIARRVAERLGLPIFDTGAVGEAGGVESDGHGTLMAHESSWVNDNRSRESREAIEQRLFAALGGKKMIWAPGVKGGDITDYHIDALARFAKPGRIVIQLPKEPDPYDPWSISALETYEILKGSTDAQGQSFAFSVIDEPLDIRGESEEFVASYVNYYVCNGAVISAEFGDEAADQAASEILSELYPGREIVQLDIDAIGEVGGGIHCATQQQPAV